MFRVDNQERSKLGQPGLAPPTAENESSPPRAGFPLPYIMTPLPDPKQPIVVENNVEELPQLDPDQSEEVGGVAVIRTDQSKYYSRLTLVIKI